MRSLKNQRLRKPFRYEGYKFDIVNACISLYIIVMFVAILVGVSWRLKYMFLVTGAGVIFNVLMGIKFKRRKRYLSTFLVWLFAAGLFVLCMCDIFRMIF